MGEASARLVRSFSQPSPTFCEYKEGDPLHALTTSISFGRFMTEPLAWEKWSSFTHNQNLEELEKFSKPGSVAEKKAYFEARYKKIAAKKAAALLEQENEAPNCSSEPNANIEIFSDSSINLDLEKSNILLAVHETQGNEAARPSTELVSAFHANECDIYVEENVLCTDQVKRAQAETDQVVLSEIHTQVKFSNKLENVEKHSKIMAIQEENTPIKDAANHDDKALSSRKKPAFSSSKSLIKNGASQLRTLVKPPTPVQPRKEVNATSNSRKTARDLTEKKRSIPQSLHMSINFASTAGESSTMSSPLLHKIGNSRNVKAFVKNPKDMSAQQAPTRVSVNGVSKHSLVVPQPQSRSRTLLDRSVLGSRTVVGKSQSLSTNHSESSIACAKKPRYPTVSSSFSFRSEERAAKRKEFFQKLEEKLLTKEAEKVHLQAKLKEKPENGLQKVRKSTGLKAKQSTNLHLEIDPPSNNMNKIPPTAPRLPKLGRKPTPSTIQDTCYRPPWRSSHNIDHTKKVIGKNKQTLSHSIASLPKNHMGENASPNIQL